MNEKAIISEISEKANDWDAKMSQFMADVGAWSDLFKVRPPKRESNTYSNPRQTEFYRAATAVGTLTYRMMTAADPFFQAMPVDPNTDFDKLDTLQHVWKTQLKYAGYKRNLLKACHFAPVFGTVICQEDYRVIGVSPFGRRIPTTVLIPRVMDQVMFDRATFEIEQANWIGTIDVTSKADLMNLAREAKESEEVGSAWNPKALEAAANHSEDTAQFNKYVLERIRRSGYILDDALRNKKELMLYYGKLDCMKDGIEYVAALVNRKFLVRFHANNFQHGRRNFRIAKWCDFDSTMGYGLGYLLGNQHRAMDANRQKAQDLYSMAAYNMWARRKNSIANEDMKIGPLEVVDMDDPNTDLKPLTPSIAGGEGIMRLDEVLKAEFRAASNAADSLQAIATDATATASTLAQNEAMRNLSVKAEINSESLVREHLENLHYNNCQNIKEKFNINKAGVAKTVYPSDFRCDLEIETKTTTDKDFTPARLDKLIQTLQILTSTKSNHPDQMQISVLPIVKEISYLLGVRPSDVISTAPSGMPMAPGMAAGDMSGLAQLMTPGGGASPGGMAPVGTPAGPALVA